mgnify:CR=1 FL=1
MYIFDTNLPPLILTGANRFFGEQNSDVKQNLYNLMQVSKANLPAGGYWVFSGQVFPASDFMKISPFEARSIDALSNFYSPHLKSETVEQVLQKYKNSRHSNSSKTSHISYTSTLENLFSAMQKVAIVDLGDLNELAYEAKRILDPHIKAIVIAAHSYGNAGNSIQYLCKQAALQNKLVIVVSRCLIGEVLEKWSTSLLKINHELKVKGKRVINGHKLNKHVAKALATRAVQEGLDQKQTQELFERYVHARGLSDQDKMTV